MTFEEELSQCVLLLSKIRNIVDEEERQENNALPDPVNLSFTKRDKENKLDIIITKLRKAGFDASILNNLFQALSEIHDELKAGRLDKAQEIYNRLEEVEKKGLQKFLELNEVPVNSEYFLEVMSKSVVREFSDAQIDYILELYNKYNGASAGFGLYRKDNQNGSTSYVYMVAEFDNAIRGTLGTISSHEENSRAKVTRDLIQRFMDEVYNNLPLEEKMKVDAWLRIDMETGRLIQPGDTVRKPPPAEPSPAEPPPAEPPPAEPSPVKTPPVKTPRAEPPPAEPPPVKSPPVSAVISTSPNASLKKPGEGENPNTHQRNRASSKYSFGRFDRARPQMGFKITLRDDIKEFFQNNDNENIKKRYQVLDSEQDRITTIKDTVNLDEAPMIVTENDENTSVSHSGSDIHWAALLTALQLQKDGATCAFTINGNTEEIIEKSESFVKMLCEIIRASSEPNFDKVTFTIEGETREAVLAAVNKFVVGGNSHYRSIIEHSLGVTSKEREEMSKKSTPPSASTKLSNS